MTAALRTVLICIIIAAAIVAVVAYVLQLERTPARAPGALAQESVPTEISGPAGGRVASLIVAIARDDAEGHRAAETLCRIVPVSACALSVNEQVDVVHVITHSDDQAKVLALMRLAIELRFGQAAILDRIEALAERPRRADDARFIRLLGEIPSVSGDEVGALLVLDQARFREPVRSK